MGEYRRGVKGKKTRALSKNVLMVFGRVAAGQEKNAS
jgi:hypothetical protein